MDKLILDFENNQITIETDHQEGIEYYENLAAKKDEIYKLLGFETVDMTPAIKTIEDMLNGKISQSEMEETLQKFIDE